MQDRGQDRSHNSRADAIPVGAVLTANEDQVTVQAMRKLAIPCRHSPWAVWFDICKIAVKTAPTIAERTPSPRGSGLDRE